MFLIPTLTVWLYVFHAVCQGQQASSLWRKPNVTMTRADRVSVAEAALEKAITFLDTSNALFPDPSDSYGMSGAFYSQLAEFDLATSQTKYADTLQQYFALASTTLSQQFQAQNFTGEFIARSINDGLNYGHGAAVAYATYKTGVFLQYAEQAWWAAKAFTLGQNDVNSGTVPSKDFTISPTCGGITTAGATFREKSSTAPDINVLATGSFLVLSALLAEATGEDLYLEAAKESADFISNHLLNAKHVVQDGLSVRANDSCALNQEKDQESYNSALMIEGLTILHSITPNASLFESIQQMVPAAIEYAGWQGNNGIIANGGMPSSKSGDLNLPRTLSTVIARNATTPVLRSYVEAYLGVQFNAVLDLATTSGSNIYAGSWNGPPSSTFSPGNQTNAIQVLISVINLHNETLATSTIPSAPGPSGSSGPTHSLWAFWLLWVYPRAISTKSVQNWADRRRYIGWSAPSGRRGVRDRSITAPYSEPATPTVPVTTSPEKGGSQTSFVGFAAGIHH
ncbi:Glycoside hydrolase family 76 protein [Mycena venus]|uniref:Glycoside hydrolase family 76 protein n=1 Tax=Mycena venus TaxID=2733690 RepID=A0A8H6YQX9_9AGAR|nr:Glycoside hydrolase family 76 protein [Mycena venus]